MWRWFVGGFAVAVLGAFSMRAIVSQSDSVSPSTEAADTQTYTQVYGPEAPKDTSNRKARGSKRLSLQEMSSIYSVNKVRSKDIEKSRPAESQKVLYGVPLRDWVLAEDNAIASRPEPVQGNGMRVYFLCMELKKKDVSPITRHECEKLHPKSQYDDIARREPRPMR